VTDLSGLFVVRPDMALGLVTCEMLEVKARIEMVSFGRIHCAGLRGNMSAC